MLDFCVLVAATTSDTLRQHRTVIFRTTHDVLSGFASLVSLQLFLSTHSQISINSDILQPIPVVPDPVFRTKLTKIFAAVPTVIVKPKGGLGVFLPLLGAYLKGLLGSAITFVSRCCLRCRSSIMQLAEGMGILRYGPI